MNLIAKYHKFSTTGTPQSACSEIFGTIFAEREREREREYNPLRFKCLRFIICRLFVFFYNIYLYLLLKLYPLLLHFRTANGIVKVLPEYQKLNLTAPNIWLLGKNKFTL
jgi:hypothetical protein